MSFYSFTKPAQGFVALALALLASGCALGPEPQRPPTAADEASAFVHAPDPPSPTAQLDPEAVDPWWQSFGDAATSALVRQALVANTDLRAAAARVVEAQAGLRQARARRLPEASLGVGVSRVKNSFTLPEVGRVATFATTYSTNLSIAYQADLFGGLRRGQQAAWADLLATESARVAVTHTVISEVVRSRVRLSTTSRALELARAIRDSWQNTLAITERRYRSGLAPTLELRLARENLAAAESTLIAAELQLEQARLALDVLLGQRPGTGEKPAAQLAALPDLALVPLGLPAGLLERRPDVRAAEMSLASATARVGVALADLFPGLTLNGSAGNNSDTIGDLLSSETLIYNLVGNLVGPIFDGGRRRAEVKAARARAEQAAASYAGSVLTALREVEDALLRDSSLRDQLTHATTRVDEARAADRIARGRYERGVTELLDVLETERRLRLAEEALQRLQADLWNTRVDLHLALGGDWQVSDDDEADSEASQRVAEELTQTSNSETREDA